MVKKVLFVLLNISFFVLHCPFLAQAVSPKEGLFDPRSGMSRVFLGAKLPVYPATANMPEAVRFELITGTRNCLIIVIKAIDKSNAYTAASFTEMFNGPWSTGSVNNYYNQCSYGKFGVAGVTSGWFTAANNYAYYSNYDGIAGTADDYGFGSWPHNAAKLVQEAIDAAEAAGVNFALYDNDSDGSVDSIFIVHQGPGAEGTSNPNDIWSHKWSLTGAGGSARFYDGKWIDAYTIQPEISSCVSGGHIEIGVFCHEYGHLIGLPDLYDTDGSSAGVGRWCLMGSGSWGGTSCSPQTPTHLSAHCKVKLGWVTPTLISFGGTLSIPQVETNEMIYQLWKNGVAGNEYFLLENRQKVGFDINLPGSGLLIWHIDSSRTTNRFEKCGACSTSSNPIVALEQADGLCNLECYNNQGDAGDPYPGLSNKRTFDESSSPKSLNYSGTASKVSITNIGDGGSVITANLQIGFLGYYVLDGYGGIHAGGGALPLSPLTPYFGWDIAKSFELIVQEKEGIGCYVLDGFGGVHAGGATPSLTPKTPYWGWNIARDLELMPSGIGYYVLDGYGGVHAGGGASSLTPPTPYFGWDIAKDLELTPNGSGYYVLDGYGGVHAGGAASPLSPLAPYWGWNIARDLELTPSGNGYYVLDGYGGIHAGGAALPPTPAPTNLRQDISVLTPCPPYFGYDIVKRIVSTPNGTRLAILDGFGGIYVRAIGSGTETMPPPLTPYWGWDIARDLKLAYSL